MNIWFFLWILFSVFVLGIFFWSIRTLLMQRRAWRTFATALNLTYQNGDRFLSSPSVNGSLGSYGFSLHTEQLRTDDMRGERFSMVVEFSLRRGLPTFGAVATKRLVPFLDTLDMPQSWRPEDAEWDESWVVRARNVTVAQTYLTPERRETIKKIFRMKALSVMFVFDRQDAVLRIETADPLIDSQKLEKIVRGLAAQLKVFEVSDAEMQALNVVADEKDRIVILPAAAPTPPSAPETPAPSDVDQ